jgi:hypothetical protein
MLRSFFGGVSDGSSCVPACRCFAAFFVGIAMPVYIYLSHLEFITIKGEVFTLLYDRA